MLTLITSKEFMSSKEMEYIEQASSNTFYPFQNKHQIHQHLQSVNMSCPVKKSKYCGSHKMGWANWVTHRFLNYVHFLYSISLMSSRSWPIKVLPRPFHKKLGRFTVKCNLSIEYESNIVCQYLHLQKNYIST